MAAYILKRTNLLRRHIENTELACARKVSINAQQRVHDKAKWNRLVSKPSHSAQTKPNQHDSTVEKTAGAAESRHAYCQESGKAGGEPFSP